MQSLQSLHFCLLLASHHACSMLSHTDWKTGMPCWGEATASTLHAATYDKMYRGSQAVFLLSTQQYLREGQHNPA